MDGSGAIGSLAERLARAGMITHSVTLEPGGAPDIAFDGVLESAALEALCDVLAGQVFRLSAFSYGFHAEPGEEAAIEALSETLSERLFGQVLPEAVLVMPLGLAEDPPEFDDAAMILIDRMTGVARAATGPGVRSVLDAGYAIAAASLAAERITELVDGVAERVRAIIPAPVGIAQGTAAPADDGRIAGLLDELGAQIAALDPAPLLARIEALAAPAPADPALIDRLAAIESALADPAPAALADPGLADRLAGIEQALAGQGEIADRLARIETALAAQPRTGNASAELAGAGLLAELETRIAGQFESLSAQIAAVPERATAGIPSFRTETEGLARLSVGMQSLMRRLDAHAVDLQETITRIQARHQESQAGASDLDARLGTMEGALMRFGEAAMQRREPGLSEKGLLRLLDPVLGQVAAVGTRVGDVMKTVQGLAARPEPKPVDLAPVEERLSGFAGVLRALADAPPPQPPDLSAIEGALAALADRVGALAARPEPKPVPVRAIEEGILRMSEDLRRLAGQPGLKPADLAPLRAEIAGLGERITTLATRPEPKPVSLRPVEEAVGRLVEEVRRLPRPEVVSIAPLEERIAQLAAEIATLSSRPEPKPVSLRPLEEGLTRLMDEIRALPQQVTDLSGLETGLAQLAGEVAALASRPDPAPVSLKPVEEAVATLAAELRALPAPLPVDLGPVEQVLDTVALRIETLAARPESAPPDLSPLLASLTAITEEIERGGRMRAQFPDIAQEREGLQRLSVALQGVLRRLDGQTETLAETVARVTSIAEAWPDFSRSLDSQFEALGSRVMAVAERAPGDLVPLSKRLDRMTETLQGLATRAVVTSQSLGPERARLQSIVLALQALTDHLQAQTDSRPGGMAEEVATALLQRMAGIEREFGRLAAERAAGAEAPRPGPRAAAGDGAEDAVVLPEAQALPDLRELAEGIAGALGPYLPGADLAARLAAVEDRLAALPDALRAALPVMAVGGPDPGPAPDGAAVQKLETRVFAEIGNLRLMLGGMRSMLAEIGRNTGEAARAPSPDPEVRARLDQISMILAEYLSRLQREAQSGAA